jgi:hypothetical protein
VNEDARHGYGRLPRKHQFRRGKSGNPKGQPKGSSNLETDLSRLMNQPVIGASGGAASDGDDGVDTRVGGRLGWRPSACSCFAEKPITAPSRLEPVRDWRGWHRRPRRPL